MTLLVVAAGLLTFASALGVGLWALAALRARLDAPWREVVAVVLGLSIESALVQWMAMAGVASHGALVATWAAFVAAGALGVALGRRRGDLRIDPRLAPIAWRPRGAAETLPLALGVVGLVANLLVAAAPSTKIDELYYHMLVPRRVVEDGALRLYSFPWEAGALPQMTYQIGAAPLHALGVADAWNVVSWALGATLAWLGWRLLARRGDDGRRLAAWWVAVSSVGLYGTIWHVTGAAHALGDLALAAALVAVVDPERVDARGDPHAYALALGALTWAAASSKATLVPASALLLVWGLARACSRSTGGRVSACALGVAPWVVFGVPIAAWTWHLTGTPYGPLLAGVFPRGAYDAAEVARLFDFAHRMGRNLPLAQLAARHVPLLWLAALGALVALRLPGRTRLALVLLVAAQAALVFTLVSWDPRFLAGIPFGLALLFAMHGPLPAMAAPRTTRAALVMTVLLIAPWLAAQLVYARPFMAASLGVVPRERFLARYVALHDDWRRLDSLLPRGAVLLDDVGRTSLFYAPRRVLVDVRDVASDERDRVYVLGFSCERRGVGPIVYTNPSAVVATYRAPGRAAERRAICVRKLTA